MINAADLEKIIQAGKVWTQRDWLQYQREQRTQVPLFDQWLQAIQLPEQQLGFLPIRFFKTQSVLRNDQRPLHYFESSGTTGSVNSRHYFESSQLYETSLLEGFRRFYGEPEQFRFFFLLPSYLERGHASLVHMARVLAEQSAPGLNPFYLYNHDQLQKDVEAAMRENRRIFLWGVTFALLDMPAISLGPDAIVMETGGMKGRRKEMVRAELHALLQEKFGVSHIHSEYGMTELFSQAYSLGKGVFQCPPWMKVWVRDQEDPLAEPQETGSGVLLVADAANWQSCAFLATEDLGTIYADGTFEVRGRLDHADLRGCNLMIT